MAEILCGLILVCIAMCVCSWFLRGVFDLIGLLLPDEKREREIRATDHLSAVADATHEWVSNWGSHTAEENEAWACSKRLNGRGSF